MNAIELNIETMQKLADTLRERGGTSSQFDGVVYELIEAGIFEAESGNFGRAVWEGKDIVECEACQESSMDTSLHNESGLVMCRPCLDEEEAK